MAVIGIDLGTTNSLASVWKDGKSVLIPNSFGEFLTPSVVGVDDEGNILVGKIAKERLISHPDKTAASFKSFMGSRMQIKLGDKEYAPEELSSFVLRKLKEDAEAYLGETVDEAVISVPAYFNDNGRNATKLAGELAGLNVERIINEPSAAALAYGISKDSEDTYLVFDFGGGTLDISIVDIFDSVVEIVSVSGDNHLGGDDFNLAIANYFCSENGMDYDLLPNEVKAILIKQAEQCKISLSTQEKAAVMLNYNDKDYTLILDNNKLLSVTANLFERIKKPILKALGDASLYADDISDVILVGGSSHMLLVQKFLESLFDRDVTVSVSPDTAVAVGVGVAVGIKERNEDIKDVILTDICPFTLGVNIHNENDPDNCFFSPLIERNTTLPASYETVLCTVCDNQRELCVKIAQGEKMYFNNNLYLGEVTMNVPPRPAGKEKILVRLTYDINGILQIDVKSMSSGKSKSKTIINNSRLSEKEVQKKIKELEKIKVHPRELDKNKFLVARAERLYEEARGDVRDYILSAIQHFSSVVESQDKRKIRAAGESFKKFLDGIENNLNNPFANFYEE